MASTLTAEMLTRLQTDDKLPKKLLDSTDLKFLSEKIAQYEALPTSTFSKITTCTSNTIQIILIILLTLFSGIPTKLGVFRKIGEFSGGPAVGLTPAFTYGVEDVFTFEQLDQLDLTGQTALVTGGNSGVGFETAKYLSKLGADVTILCRSDIRCAVAAKAIRKEGGKISTLIADMSDLKSTRAATMKYSETITNLDMLYFNAGIGNAGLNEDGSLVLSVDGIEKVFATNHVGHHLMWTILAEKVKASPMGRVVMTSSASNFDTYDYGIALDLETLNNAKEAPAPLMKNYGQSKLAQIMWAQELTRQLGQDSTVYINSYHPGLAATEIMYKNPSFPKFLHSIFRFVAKNVFWNQKDGALTQIYLGAASKDVKDKNIRGQYFHPQVQRVTPNEKFATDLELQKGLWEFSNELIKRG